MARILARVAGAGGELALVERDGHHELIANGVFLMDTRDGRSERLLVRAAVEHASRPVRRILLGGLGVGFSLAEALAVRDVEEVLVVEREHAVVAWNRRLTGPRTGGSVDAPGVRCVVADLVRWLPGTPARAPFDLVCLDVDNGPDWLVTDGNGWLYGPEGVTALHRRVAPGGALSVWSSTGVDGLVRQLADRFVEVLRHEVSVPRGEPDTVVVARR